MPANLKDFSFDNYFDSWAHESNFPLVNINIDYNELDWAIVKFEQSRFFVYDQAGSNLNLTQKE